MTDQPDGPPPLPDTVRQKTADGARALRRHQQKIARLQLNLQADARRAEEAPLLREMGEVLKTQLHAVAKGAKLVQLPVPWQPERTLTIALQPELSPLDNLQRIFQRAKGLQRSVAVIAERQAGAEALAARLQAHAQQLADLLQRAAAWQQAKDAQRELPEKPRQILRDAETWLQGLAALGVAIGQQPAAKPAAKVAKALPKGVDVFTSPGGWPVLAGRSAEGNDALVTRLLRGRDWWMHVRDSTGAHVVVVAQKPVPDSEMLACAALCAHLSGIAKGAHAEVTVCQGKGVRKVKGAPAGSVYVSGEKSWRILVTAEIVDGFYARKHGAAIGR